MTKSKGEAVSIVIFFILLTVLTALSWGIYTLWVQYGAYRDIAERDLVVLDQKLTIAQNELVRMRHACNKVITDPYYFDESE